MDNYSTTARAVKTDQQVKRFAWTLHGQLQTARFCKEDIFVPAPCHWSWRNEFYDCYVSPRISRIAHGVPIYAAGLSYEGKESGLKK